LILTLNIQKVLINNPSPQKVNQRISRVYNKARAESKPLHRFSFNKSKQLALTKSLNQEEIYTITYYTQTVCHHCPSSKSPSFRKTSANKGETSVRIELTTLQIQHLQRLICVCHK